MKLKGIIVLGFNDTSEAHIETQFPSNICEFLGITLEILKRLIKIHMDKKMEPHFAEILLNTDVKVASFYSGFSFRHYVGKPNFAICVFLSQEDVSNKELEGRLRRIAHELLPKREALNFDDILGQYFSMLKKDELSTYWEEIIEGETKAVKVNNPEGEKQINFVKKTADKTEKRKQEVGGENLLMGNEYDEIKNKDSELENLLEEKKSKIRELTRKYTEKVSENAIYEEEIQSLKDEISEQYIKLEKWSQQMADLNQNNAKLIDDLKILNQKIYERDEFLKEKEKRIEVLSNKLTGIEKLKVEAEKVLQEKEDMKNINIGLSSELEKSENTQKRLLNENEKLKVQNSADIDSITTLKLNMKNLKSEVKVKENEQETFKDQILDFKKEIKILRRERDHYRKIVKEKNLL
jgi:chromosome segregation ATPase